MLPSETIVQNLDKYKKGEVVILGYNQPQDGFNEDSFSVIDLKDEIYRYHMQDSVIDEKEISRLLYSK
mgnify:CR=1 FL=1